MRLDRLGRRLKKAQTHLQKEAEFYISEDLLQDSSWSRKIRDDTVKVVGLSQRPNGQNKIYLIPDDPDVGCYVKLTYGKEDSPREEGRLRQSEGGAWTA